jgi:hypothetical protein
LAAPTPHAAAVPAPHEKPRRRVRLKRPDSLAQWSEISDPDCAMALQAKAALAAMQEDLFDQVVFEDWMRMRSPQAPLASDRSTGLDGPPPGEPEEDGSFIDPFDLLRLNVQRLTARSDSERQSARAWLTAPHIAGRLDPDDDYPSGRIVYSEEVAFSFRHCCRLLGINPDRLLEVLTPYLERKK